MPVTIQRWSDYGSTAQLAILSQELCCLSMGVSSLSEEIEQVFNLPTATGFSDKLLEDQSKDENDDSGRCA